MDHEISFEKIALIADPIHSYIPFTVPCEADEMTEKALIDSPWMQRLRYINQLQSARWVYPSAEHSRFVHSLGTMHVAGRFARQIYPSLKALYPDCPSFCFIEALLRLVGLVHDIGHGPFCHFFDHHFLKQHNLTHEIMGQVIVLKALAPLITKIRRSVSGDFALGEKIDPHQIAYLMNKVETGGANGQALSQPPPWLIVLKPLFSGIFTVDNLDYVLRDAYMCGVAIGPIDLDRLMHYTFCTKQGLTLHKNGLPALRMFLNARSYLYSNVYNHRTTRAIDAHLQDIFPKTMQEIFPHHPLKRLNDYLGLTDWSLLLTVQSWEQSRSPERKRLSLEWKNILLRDVKWKMAYETTFSPRENQRKKIKEINLEKAIRIRLPADLSQLSFRVDMASQDPRPVDPLKMGDRQLYIYNPSSRSVSKESLMEFLDSLPSTLIQCRVFSQDHEHDLLLSHAADSVLRIFLEKKKERRKA